MKKSKGGKWLVLLFAAVVLVLGLSSIVVTYPNEYAVVKQFGKIVSVRESAGLSFKVPFIQKVDKIENEVLLYDLAVSDVMTKDKKSMIADCFAVKYGLFHVKKIKFQEKERLL